MSDAYSFSMQALQACIGCESQAAVQSAALRGIASTLKAAAAGTAGDAAVRWAHACFDAAVPAAVVSAREAAQAPAVSSADVHVVQVSACRPWWHSSRMALLLALRG